MGSLRHPRRTELSIFKGRSSETTTDELLTVLLSSGVSGERARRRHKEGPATRADLIACRRQERRAWPTARSHRATRLPVNGGCRARLQCGAILCRRDSLSSLSSKIFFRVPQTTGSRPPSELGGNQDSSCSAGHGRRPCLGQVHESSRCSSPGGVSAWRVASDQSFEGSAAPLGCCRRGRYYPASIRRQAREKMIF